MVASAIAVIGTLVLAAGIAWPRAPLGRPGAAAGYPDSSASDVPAPEPATQSPGATPSSAPPSAVPSASATSSAPGATPAAVPAGPPPAPPGWTLVDYDDFNGNTVDTQKWQVYEASSTNGTSQWLRSMVSVGGGELRIAGQGKNPDGQGNVSGGLCWCRGKGNQTYGMWQVRARFEKGNGYGQAILLWPQSNHWPDDGELDFVETPFASKTTAVGTVHWGSDNQEDERRVTGDYAAWHTYAVEWRAGSVKMSIDGVVYYDSTTSSRRPAIPDTPMQLAIQQEPGPFGTKWVPAPDSSTPDQVVMHIDWVRIYR